MQDYRSSSATPEMVCVFTFSLHVCLLLHLGAISNLTSLHCTSPLIFIFFLSCDLQRKALAAVVKEELTVMQSILIYPHTDIRHKAGHVTGIRISYTFCRSLCHAWIRGQKKNSLSSQHHSMRWRSCDCLNQCWHLEHQLLKYFVVSLASSLAWSHISFILMAQVFIVNSLKWSKSQQATSWSDSRMVTPKRITRFSFAGKFQLGTSKSRL